jgi:hypothetical protein
MLVSAASSSFACLTIGYDLVHFLDRKRRATLALQEIKGIRNLAGGPRRLYFDPAVRQLLYGNFLAGMPPRCSSRSLRKVTWPLAVTVRVLMASLVVVSTRRM